MSRGPKFVDPKKRGIYGTPAFKYYLGATFTVLGFSTAVAYFASLYCQKDVDKLFSKKQFIKPATDVIDAMLLEDIRAIKRMEQEFAARQK